jgi:isopentenyl-diphosphate delta-isomerase
MCTLKSNRARAPRRDTFRAGAPGPQAALGRYKAGSRSTDTSFDQVILVDKNDRALGTMPKLDAHRRGCRHRAISVIVRDGHGRLLLQQRAACKYHSPGLWTNTCCSHPRLDELAIDAASRRLVEEMGLLTSLGPLFTMRYRAQLSNSLIEHEFVHVFGGISDKAPQPAASEVAGWRWMSWHDVQCDIDLRPQTYTVWFRRMVRDHGTEIAGFCRQPAGSAESFATRRRASALAARRR